MSVLVRCSTNLGGTEWQIEGKGEIQERGHNKGPKVVVLRVKLLQVEETVAGGLARIIFSTYYIHDLFSKSFHVKCIGFRFAGNGHNLHLIHTYHLQVTRLTLHRRRVNLQAARCKVKNYSTLRSCNQKFALKCE